MSQAVEKIGSRGRAEPGKGYRKGEYVRHVVSFDEETFAEVRAVAVSDETSFTEAVRKLVEFGLEVNDE